MLNNNLTFLKKIYLQVCLIYTFKIFKTILQENRIKYNFARCEIATNMDQLFNFHIFFIFLDVNMTLK